MQCVVVGRLPMRAVRLKGQLLVGRTYGALLYE
jgi:hypothetical protein